MAKRLSDRALTTILKVGVFAVLAIIGEFLFGWALSVFGYFTASTLSVFAAAAVANALAMRIYERHALVGVGLEWNSASVRNVLLGLGGGIVSALFVTLGPVLEGAAALRPLPGQTFDWTSLVFVVTLIVFGGIGEEMLFHGYGFQILMLQLGPFATILPVSVLFALMHSGNLNVTVLGLVNTGLWGVVLGYAFYRSGDLWLPIGLHVGWNWTLPLFGTPLSGFRMGVTGYTLDWRSGTLWSGGDYGPEAGLLTTAVLVVLFTWLALKAPVRRQTPYLLRERWEEM